MVGLVVSLADVPAPWLSLTRSWGIARRTPAGAAGSNEAGVVHVDRGREVVSPEKGKCLRRGTLEAGS